MRAADALLLPDLRDACLQVTQQQLSPDNALSLLLAAHQANLEALEAAVMEYAVQHIRGMWLLGCPRTQGYGRASGLESFC
jgi:hypothetical protein